MNFAGFVWQTTTSFAERATIVTSLPVNTTLRFGPEFLFGYLFVFRHPRCQRPYGRPVNARALHDGLMLSSCLGIRINLVLLLVVILIPLLVLSFPTFPLILPRLPAPPLSAFPLPALLPTPLQPVSLLGFQSAPPSTFRCPETPDTPTESW